MYSALSFQTFSLHKVAHLFSKLYLALLANCIWRSNFSLSMCSSQTWAFSSMSADDNMITSDIFWYDHRWWYCKLWPYSHDVIFISFCADSSTSVNIGSASVPYCCLNRATMLVIIFSSWKLRFANRLVAITFFPLKETHSCQATNLFFCFIESGPEMIFHCNIEMILVEIESNYKSELMIRRMWTLW